MNARLCTISELNAMDRESFSRTIGPVFERSPWIAERAWEKRPFLNAETLHRVLYQTVLEADDSARLELIRAHPDLVGRAAQAGTLTRESAREQTSAGLGELSAKEVQMFQGYNLRYHQRFGFPFIICARLNRMEAILAGFARRLEHSRDEEIQTALEEIFKIARLRLEDIVEKGAG